MELTYLGIKRPHESDMPTVRTILDLIHIGFIDSLIQYSFRDKTRVININNLKVFDIMPITYFALANWDEFQVKTNLAAIPFNISMGFGTTPITAPIVVSYRDPQSPRQIKSAEMQTLEDFINAFIVITKDYGHLIGGVKTQEDTWPYLLVSFKWTVQKKELFLKINGPNALFREIEKLKNEARKKRKIITQ